MTTMKKKIYIYTWEAEQALASSGLYVPPQPPAVLRVHITQCVRTLLWEGGVCAIYNNEICACLPQPAREAFFLICIPTVAVQPHTVLLLWIMDSHAARSFNPLRNAYHLALWVFFPSFLFFSSFFLKYDLQQLDVCAKTATGNV